VDHNDRDDVQRDAQVLRLGARVSALEVRVQRVEGTATEAARLASDSSHEIDATKVAFAARMDELTSSVNRRLDGIESINTSQSSALATLVAGSTRRFVETRTWGVVIVTLVIVGSLAAYGVVPLDKFAAACVIVGGATLWVLNKATETFKRGKGSLPPSAP
jgi:hypothetical protein